MSRRLLCSLALLLAAGCVRMRVERSPAAGAATTVALAPAAALAEVSAMMTRSAASWNRGDLAGYMAGMEALVAHLNIWTA